MSLLYVDGELMDANWRACVNNSYGERMHPRCSPVWAPEFDRKVCVVEPRPLGTYDLFMPNVYWGLGLNGRSKVELTWFRVSKIHQKYRVPPAYLLALMVLN